MSLISVFPEPLTGTDPHNLSYKLNYLKCSFLFFFVNHEWNILAKPMPSYHEEDHNYMNEITESIVFDKDL